MVNINSSTVQDEAQMPFGGVKSSGVGRFGGKAGIVAQWADAHNAVAQNWVKADWSRFRPTKAVNRNQPGCTQ